MNWKTQVLWLLFVCIPMTGAWHCTRVYQTENQQHQVKLSQLAYTDYRQWTEFQLDEFYLRDDEPVSFEGHEYALVDSSETVGEHSQVILLRRSSELDGSLSERLSTGAVQGTVRSGYFRYEEVMQLGLGVSCSDPEQFLIFDLDGKREGQFANTVWAMIGLSIYGFVFALYLNGKIEGNEFRDRQRRNRVQSQVALQLLIARQDTCLLYTSPSPRDATLSRMPSSA